MACLLQHHSYCMQPRKNSQRFPTCLLASLHTKCFFCFRACFLEMFFCFYLDPCRFEHLLGEVWILTKKSGWPGWLWAALWFFFGTSKYVFHIYLCSSQEIRTAEWTTSILQKARIRFVSFQHFLCVLLFVAKIISSAVVFTSFEETNHFVCFCFF